MIIDARWVLITSSIGCLVGSAAIAAAQERPLIPQYDSGGRLGVASCASATCHGAATPAEGGVVLQNEYTTWQTRDKHAGAYNLLLNDESKRMASRLGIGEAHTAKICLDCHADNIPVERRGPQFQLADGVGCESCHGAAENWIEVHTINANQTSHQRNIDAGLYPTPDPVARAELCLSCHFGDETKFVTHRIMGAGHPRLSFELDTFTAIEPAHFVVDDDYRERKDVASGVQTWAVGQAVTLVSALDGVLDPDLGRDGLFPELAFFDCYACHKPMSSGRWQERPSVSLGPGVVRFNDSSLIMCRIIARVVAPSLAEELDQRGRALHQATKGTSEEWTAAARALRESANRAVQVFAQHDFDLPDMRALLAALVQEGERGEYLDYAAAEQTTMAIGSILTVMQEADWMSKEESGRVEAVMAAMYDAVEEDEEYQPSAHLAALRQLKEVAP